MSARIFICCEEDPVLLICGANSKNPNSPSLPTKSLLRRTDGLIGSSTRVDQVGCRKVGFNGKGLQRSENIICWRPYCEWRLEWGAGIEILVNEFNYGAKLNGLLTDSRVVVSFLASSSWRWSIETETRLETKVDGWRRF